jgi:hypothetical protein
MEQVILISCRTSPPKQRKQKKKKHKNTIKKHTHTEPTSRRGSRREEKIKG